MKTKMSLVIALVITGLCSQAQQKSEPGKASFGLRGGVNFQNINGKDEDGNKLSNDLLTGFNVGINAEIPIAPQFYFQPGLLYTTKGAKNNNVVLGQSIGRTLKISYLELPLNFVFKPMLGAGHMLLGFGPYIALGVGGNAKYELNGVSQTQDIDFKNTVSDSDPRNVTYFRPLDAGANLLAGYEFSNRISFQLNAQLGLAKINSKYENSNDKTSVKNTGFGVSLGYRF